MPRTCKKKLILSEAKSWATTRGLFGIQALLKHVILRFNEDPNQVSAEIVFNGGSLLTAPTREQVIGSKWISFMHFKPILLRSDPRYAQIGRSSPLRYARVHHRR